MSFKQSVSIVVAAFIGGVVGAGIVLSEVRAQEHSELVRAPKTLTANAIELTDGNGHIRCKISAEGGSPICFFYGPVGKVRMRIGLGGPEDDYAPFIAMNDKDTHERLGIGLGKNKEGRFTSFLRMRDSQGRGRLGTLYQEGLGPSFALLDDSGAVRGSLTQFDEKQQNASLLLANPTSEDSVRLLISELGPMLSLGSGKASLTAAAAKSNGSNVFLEDGSGNLKMHLGVGACGKTRFWRFGKGLYGYQDKKIEIDAQKRRDQHIPKVEELDLHGYPKLEGH